MYLLEYSACTAHMGLSHLRLLNLINLGIIFSKDTLLYGLAF